MSSLRKSTAAASAAVCEKRLASEILAEVPTWELQCRDALGSEERDAYVKWIQRLAGLGSARIRCALRTMRLTS